MSKINLKNAQSALMETAKTVGITFGGHVAGAALLGRYSTLAGIPVHIFAQMKGAKYDWLKLLSLGMITAVGFNRPAQGTNGLGEMLDEAEAENMGFLPDGRFSFDDYKKGVKARASNHWSNFSRNLTPWKEQDGAAALPADTSGLGNVHEFENPFAGLDFIEDAEVMDGLGDTLLEPEIINGFGDMGRVKTDPIGTTIM